ncbi:hypothetical protein C8R44DRAFT_740406 [Mycena epipterygia]|nr:hypothetical protein C8R44DRAFT_740406 [Mycena epipterygia]
MGRARIGSSEDYCRTFGRAEWLRGLTANFEIGDDAEPFHGTSPSGHSSEGLKPQSDSHQESANRTELDAVNCSRELKVNFRQTLFRFFAGVALPRSHSGDVPRVAETHVEALLQRKSEKASGEKLLLPLTLFAQLSLLCLRSAIWPLDAAKRGNGETVGAARAGSRGGEGVEPGIAHRGLKGKSGRKGESASGTRRDKDEDSGSMLVAWGGGRLAHEGKGVGTSTTGRTAEECGR